MKHFLFAYLGILCLIISGISVYAAADYLKEFSKMDIQNADNATNEDASAVTLIDSSLLAEENPPFREKISISELVEDNLGSGSKITTMGQNGVQRFPCLNARKTHCDVFIYITAENTEDQNYRLVLSCSVNDPLSKKLEKIPFANANITIEREVYIKELCHPMIEDTDTGILLDRETYVTLLALLDYYSGNKDYDSYLDDPLAGSSIEHSYVNTAPRIAPL